MRKKIYPVLLARRTTAIMTLPLLYMKKALTMTMALGILHLCGMAWAQRVTLALKIIRRSCGAQRRRAARAWEKPKTKVQTRPRRRLLIA